MFQWSFCGKFSDLTLHLVGCGVLPIHSVMSTQRWIQSAMHWEIHSEFHSVKVWLYIKENIKSKILPANRPNLFRFVSWSFKNGSLFVFFICSICFFVCFCSNKHLYQSFFQTDTSASRYRKTYMQILKFQFRKNA